MLDNCEVRPGKFIGVCVSLDNCRLFIGSIPKDKKKEEIMEEMKKVGREFKSLRNRTKPPPCLTKAVLPGDRRRGGRHRLPKLRGEEP